VEIKEHWDMIPNDIDVLITHGPPRGHNDIARDWHNPLQDINVGCPSLRSKIAEIKPQLHCFGHIHGGYGYSKNERTTFINASICDDNYDPRNKAFSFSLEQRYNLV
jgi:Icc-related predicted phosphoesterase